MTRLATLAALSLLTLPLPALLSGCGDGEQKDRPVDGRDTDGLYEPAVEDYSGRVIDGYLRNARVWLDLDGDYQYDAANVEVVVGTNPERTLILASGEPTAMSGEGGQFILDLSSFDIDPSLASDLEPTDYPLVAVVIPGVTEEETGSGYVTLGQAYQMSAPPGERYVTPLTTLMDARRVLGVGPLDVTSGLGEMLGNTNVLGDYVRAGDHRAHAYAQALARFLADQFPDEFEDAVVENEGRITVFSNEASRILRLSLNGNAEDVFEAVDAARGPGGHYEGIDIGSVPIPKVPLDLDNPILLKNVVVRASENGAPQNQSALDSNARIVAELTYRYNEAGILQAIEANGCMNPSLLQIARLANAKGRVRELGMQGLEGFYLKEAVSRDQYLPEDAEAVDEVLMFDWENNRAEFRTTTNCHGLAPSSEMPVDPQVTYTWMYGAEDLVDTVESSQGPMLSPVYDANARAPIFSYTTRHFGGRALTLQGQPVECIGDIDPEQIEAPRVVSAQQSYAFTGDASAANMADPPVPADGRVTGLKLDWDTRDDRQRLLRQVFYDAAFSTDSLLQWDYRAETDEAFADEVQSNLIKQARLAFYEAGDAWTCGDVRPLLTESDLLAELGYGYIRLSDYIAENQQP
ncbi:hypothetical protein [Marinobacter fonticola]|uniref:hypothetical protein n=1 Tax=Marinobacter fonticola TaxID=2603215 RepID=UPI0011E72823|nr:hypothetical protein [Marinobacter fonticola]